MRAADNLANQVQRFEKKRLGDGPIGKIAAPETTHADCRR
jgi:hypothetical protein